MLMVQSVDLLLSKSIPLLVLQTPTFQLDPYSVGNANSCFLTQSLCW